MKHYFLFLTFTLFLACERIDHTGQNPDVANQSRVAPQEVARMLSSLPLGDEQLREVYDAVCASSGNGYDEEYTLQDLFTVPGAGVGDKATKAAKRNYKIPLKDMIANYLSSTKAGGELFSVKDLEESGLQLYWPWYDKWDGSSYPAITFDPGDGSKSNTAFQLSKNEDGSIGVKEIVVTEDYASANPVWVVNTNDDAAYTSIELLRREADSGGGAIVIGKKGASVSALPENTKSSGDSIKTLVIKDFTMMRNYDSWLCGGSEFFIKCASVENFTAVTEAEMRLYNPSVTDFMICVQRKDVGVKQEINAILVDDWRHYMLEGEEYGLERCAFLVIEDDGGTWTEWAIEAEVKLKSKTYGLKLSIPLRSNDDIVWRGTLSENYFTKYAGERGRFGDVEITFDMLTR
ncbi:MAG: hypothetical protein IJ151_07565 [Bacteroidales bacterium]|nr:hypothetical protein [Bacteroidales bacterium]